MKVVAVIPARLGSTRMNEKVLRLIQGRPMIQHVWERAKQTKGLDDVIVACDDERVQACVEDFGGKAVLTSQDHPNGSSRVAEVAAKTEADVLINIQGDEPLIDPRGVGQLQEIFRQDKSVQVATLAVKKRNLEDCQNPNIVKVVCNEKGDALYFSRAPIPYDRSLGQGSEIFLKHLGIYGYRKSFLLDFVGWQPGFLEDIEKLEQLRILERGISIRVLETTYDSWSVDTEEDLEIVEKKMAKLKRGA
ncbi:MAG: 3-deoxy-manno-octulosonate cytidylyltransferase [Candidatus Omnitrophica bacterium]|nr:3-deoxy-manno-octulosonate cytidylyltransferase [Candidatus Omnitrophota bacterium]